MDGSTFFKQALARNPASMVPAIFTLVLSCVTFTAAAENGPTQSRLPLPAQTTIVFDRDVRPIFQQSCFRCHGPEKPKSSFRLDDREEALKGGDDNRNDIIPGDSERSPLILYVAGLDPEIAMPPPQSAAKPLSDEQISVLRAWIDQGARWGTNAASPAFALTVTPALRWIGVDGDAHKFRELEGVREGWGGGAENFSLTQRTGPDSTLTLGGHALWPAHDFKLTFALDKNGLGFVRGGFESWRKYTDDSGGFFPGFTPSLFSLDRDLHLDVGRAWVDWGLARPGWPRFLLGYEYQYRQGTKSTLIWGTVFQNGDARNTYPNAESINEHTHILKFNVTEDWRGWEFDDRARVEFYRLAKSRNDVSSYTSGPTPDLAERVNQRVSYTQGVNSFRATKQIKDWWRVSAGCLYSRFGGASDFNQNAVNGAGAISFGQSWRTEGITLERESRIVSLSSLFLPVKGLSLSGAGQAEWSHEKGFGNVDLDFGDPTMSGSFFLFPGTVNANLDRTETSERFDARYSRIPRTTVFADAELRQESIGQFDQAVNDLEPVEQRTDALNHLFDALAGFTSSPWPWLEYGAHVRRRDSSTGYNNRVSLPGDGYPGFINHRDIQTDEVAGRVVVRPVYWFNARLTYRWSSTRYSSSTDPVDNGALSSGGPILDGRTIADNVGLALNFTPGQRFYFAASLAYGYSRTTTLGAAPEIPPYFGNIYTVGANAGYVLNARTKLKADYLFSKSTYGHPTSASLPLGLDFERHEVLVGVTRQLTKSVTATLRYDFSQYSDSGSRGANDFTAHGVFVSVSFLWP